MDSIEELPKRIIKFRAWNGKFMVDAAFGDFVSFDGVPYTEPEKRYDTPNIEITKAKDYILMQFTGLLDKDGKEIYEGDRLQLFCEADPSDYIMEAEVYWDSDRFGWYLKCEHPSGQIIEDSLMEIAGEPGYIQVIGNIYQNPDLL